MSISALFIKRPVMTTLIMAAILLFGLVSYRNLAVSDLPTVDYPTVSVNASLPGASPETMASSVATPLEKQFSTIAGIDAMTSQSALGSTSITLQFALDRNIDAAAADVQAAISQPLRRLPQNIVPPASQKVAPSATPIPPSPPPSTPPPPPQPHASQQTSLAPPPPPVCARAPVPAGGAGPARRGPPRSRRGAPRPSDAPRWRSTATTWQRSTRPSPMPVTAAASRP